MMWIGTIPGVESALALASLAGGCIPTSHGGPAQLELAFCRGHLETVSLTTGVEELWCHPGTDNGVYGVIIDDNREGSELWILEELPPNGQGSLGQPARDRNSALLRKPAGELGRDYNALVAINGFTFDTGDAASQSSTVVFESTYQIGTRNDLETHTPTPNKVITGNPPSYFMSFPPVGAGSLFQASYSADHLPPVGAYDLYESTWPLFDYNASGQNQCTEIDFFGNPVVGISSGSDGTRKLVMLYPLTYYTSFQLCTLLGQMDVNWAVYQDGGPSAALHIADQLPALNEIHDHPEEGCASDDCRVAYAVGLVALGANLVQNAGFEAPDITSAPPCGRGGSDTHPFQNYVWTDPSQQCYRSWIGSTFLRRMSLAHGRQVAAIGNRVPLNPEDIGNYLVQTIAVPNNTYCELHFWHGFNRDTQGFGCPSLEQSSNLDVTIDDDAGQQITSLHQTWSDTSTLGQAWLRFLTPPSGQIHLKFRASGANQNCEVLLDDVSVRCTR